MTTATLGELADAVGGTVIGDRSFRVRSLTSIDRAGPEDLTFLTNPKYEKALRQARAGAVISRTQITWFTGPQLLHPNPYLAFARISATLHPAVRPQPGIHATAVVAPDAHVAADASLGPFVAVGSGSVIGARSVLYPGVVVGAECAIGEDVVIHPNVAILDRVRIGDRVMLNAGSVIGAEGYGFVFDGEKHVKVPQVGAVVIEDDVELGAHNTVDRATLGETRIGAGSKTDDHVHIAHNVKIGKHCLVVAMTGISGSATVGDRVTIAGQVGVAGHVTIGDDSVIAARSGVTKSLPAKSIVAGFPAQDLSTWRRVHVLYTQLPSLAERIRDLEKQVAVLTERKESE